MVIWITLTETKWPEASGLLSISAVKLSSQLFYYIDMHNITWCKVQWKQTFPSPRSLSALSHDRQWFALQIVFTCLLFMFTCLLSSRHEFSRSQTQSLISTLSQQHTSHGGVVQVYWVWSRTIKRTALHFVFFYWFVSSCAGTEEGASSKSEPCC